MINIIKTAIITIIISIISGLLLEHFKNLAPRILCKTGDLKPIKINNKKVYSYSITVSNISNKIIHDLTVNIQNPQGNLKIANSKITKGLKYESSIDDNNIDMDIPYLSKGDKFSIVVYLENEYEAHNKPVIVMRSPENFKQIDSAEKNGMLASLLNKKSATPNVHKKAVPNKKVIVTTISIILVLIVVVLGKLYLNQASANSAKTNDVKQSTDKETGNTYNNTTPEATNKSTTKGVTTTNTGTNTAPKSTTKGTGTNTLPANTNTNTGANTPTDSTTKSTDTNTTPGSTTKNTDTNTTPDGTTQNTSTNTASGSTTTNTGTNASQTGNTAK